MPNPLRIWCSQAFAPEIRSALIARLNPHSIVWPDDARATNLVSVGRDTRLVDSIDIAFGQPVPEDVLASTSLKWVQLSSAGYTRYDRDDLRVLSRSRGLAICNASGVYSEPCAQHALAMILADLRQLPASVRSQAGDRGWPYAAIRSASRLLGGQVVLLVGYGAIASRLAELLRPFGLDVRGFRRRLSGRETVPCFSIDRLDAHLPEADLIVNILPASESTKNFFDTARLTRCKPGGRIYNIGRGDTIDQAALEAALRNGTLAGAYLDVTTPEPLPPEHPLWLAPHCNITPHTAGGFIGESQAQVEHFLANLDRFVSGAALADRIM